MTEIKLGYKMNYVLIQITKTRIVEVNVSDSVWFKYYAFAKSKNDYTNFGICNLDDIDDSFYVKQFYNAWNGKSFNRNFFDDLGHLKLYHNILVSEEPFSFSDRVEFSKLPLKEMKRQYIKTHERWRKNET